MKTRKFVSVFLILVMVFSFAATAQAAGVAGFDDVSSDAYYAEAVTWAAEAGITNGMAAGVFSPDSTVTRAQAVTLLWRIAGRPAPKGSASVFSDVTDPDAFYYAAVLWAAEEGITNGMGGGLFSPDGTLTYEQILALLCRTAGGDAMGEGWSQKAQAWASAHGVTSGISYVANAQCPRRDVIYFLWKQSREDAPTGDGDVPAEDQPNETGLSTGLLYAQGAEAAILDGFLRRATTINVSAYNLTAAQAVDLAESLADIDGRNIYRVSPACAVPRPPVPRPRLCPLHTLQIPCLSFPTPMQTPEPLPRPLWPRWWSRG